MRRLPIFLAALCIFISGALPHLYSASIVTTPLGRAFSELFPELSEGYIDLNANSSLDRLEDMDELIPESLVQDEVLQVQEVLDFIIEQFRFFSVQDLESIQEILENAEGEIAELIALSYRNRIAEVVEKKREFGSDDLYLTPSALRRANEEMSGYIATMLHAYKKEEQEYVRKFSEARGSLFSMLEAGYPLPQMGMEDRELLTSAMIHTIITSGDSNPQRVKAAIGTLGSLKAENALPYLERLLDSQQYQVESAKALGDIGNSAARTILMEKLDDSENGAFQYALLRAIGKIGGDESEKLILDLVPQETSGDSESSNSTMPPEKEQNVLQALADIAQRQSRNRQIFTVLSRYLIHPKPELRQIAVEGVAGFGPRLATPKLLPLLAEEKNETVKISLVRNLNSLNDPATIAPFVTLLDDPAASSELKQEVISAIGANPNGSRAAVQIMEFLQDENPQLRTATRGAIVQLYGKDSKTVIGALSRGVLQSENRLFQEEASSILAQLADEASLATLLKLLESPYPQVRKNVTWAFYRIKPDNNARVAAELQKLVTSETEALTVRTNAVRALGAMGYDSPQLQIDKTLLTSLKLQAAEYSMLRYFAIKALGKIAEPENEVVEALFSAMRPREERFIREAAMQAVRDIGIGEEGYADGIAGLAKRSDTPAVKLEAVKLLGDMGSEEAVTIAAGLIHDDEIASIYHELSYALAQIGNEDAIDLMIDMAADEEYRDFITGQLEEIPAQTLRKVVNRRSQTEQDRTILSILEELQSSLETSL